MLHFAIQWLASKFVVKCDIHQWSALIKVAKKSSNLQQLQMEYVELGDREATPTLIENCKNLKKLHFFNDASVFDDKACLLWKAIDNELQVFQYVAQNCTGLEKLEIGCNDNRYTVLIVNYLTTELIVY